MLTFDAADAHPLAGSYSVNVVSRSNERVALVALLQTRPGKLTWPEITARVLESGSAVDVWTQLVPETLLDAPGEPDPLRTAAAEISRWDEQSLSMLTILDDEYPTRLRGVHQAPPLLYARGEVVANDPAVSVVGSRAASARGVTIAQDIAAALVSEGLTVVAGLALGIDTAAHRAALDVGGRTVAIIGTGINVTYPAANRELHDEIATRGLLLSQFWPDAPPQKHTFLMRNATMSGYGLATVVIEAGEQSGARAQARMAVGHGRPVILTTLVIERNEWAQALLNRPGVHAASSVDDVLAIVRGLTSDRGIVEDVFRTLVRV
jgi:DNA processing protein